MCSLFLTLLFLFSLSCLIYVDASLSSSDRLKVINAFNQARCQVTPAAAVMNNLRWDSALEFAVQQYVDSCPTNINNPDTQASSNYQRQGGKEGEIGRIVALANVDDAISQWKAEANIPDPFRCQLDEVMTKSRYTQLVWTNSVNVACATPSAGTTCQNFALTVCYFFPAGNVKNELPYVATGAAMRPQTNACLAQDATTLPTAAVGSVTSPPIPATSAPVTSAPVVPAAPPNTQPEQAGGGGTTVNGGAVAAGVLIPILLIIVGVICYIKRDALKRKWTNHRNKTNEAALKSLDIANHNKRGAIRNDNYYDPGKKVQHEGGYGRSESTIDPPDAGDEIMTSSPLQGIMISTPTVMTSPTIVNARNPAPYSQQAHSAPYSSQQTHSVPYSTGPYSAPHTTTALSVPTRHQQQESLGEDFMSNPMASMPTSNFELLAAQVCARPTARPFENYPSATSTTPSYDEEIPPPMPTKKKKKGAPPSHKPRVQPTYDDVPPRGISVVHHHNDSHQHIHVHHIHQHIHVHGTEEDVPPPPPSGGPPADVMRKKKKGAIRMHGAHLPRELEY